MKQLFFITNFILVSSWILVAQKPITIDDIFAKHTFRTKSVPGFNFMKDGKHYSELKDENIRKMDITTGSLTETIFNAKDFDGKSDFKGSIDGYTFSEDESKILISCGIACLNIKHCHLILSFFHTLQE